MENCLLKEKNIFISYPNPLMIAEYLTSIS